MGADYTFYGCSTSQLVDDNDKVVATETYIHAEYGITTSRNTFECGLIYPFDKPIKTDIFFHGVKLPSDKSDNFVCVSKKFLIKCINANIKSAKSAGDKADIVYLTSLKDTINKKFKGLFEDKRFDNVVIHLSC